MRHSEQTDHRCQSCGAGFSLRPWLFFYFVLGALSGASLVQIGALALVAAPVVLAFQGAAESVVLIIVGTVSLAAGFGSLLLLAGPQVHAWRNPLVPGAEMPELCYGPPQEHRLCSCGAAAAPVCQRANTIARFPAGKVATYLCPACGREFETPDRWAVAAHSAITLFLGAITAFLAALKPFHDLRGDHFFVLGVLGVGALVGALLVALGFYQRLRHPMA